LLCAAGLLLSVREAFADFVTDLSDAKQQREYLPARSKQGEGEK